MIHFPEPRDVKLRNVQTRMEKHGEDDVPALDLHIAITGGNTLLDMLHRDLRRALFKPITETEGELSLPIDDLPSVRFARLKAPVKFDIEQPGMTLRVAYGVSGKADMVLGSIKLSKPEVFAFIEGGSVEMRMLLSTTDVNEKTIGKLSLLQGHDLTITLTAPEVQPEKTKPLTEKDVFDPLPKVDAKGNPVQNRTEDAPKTPEQAFADTEPAQE